MKLEIGFMAGNESKVFLKNLTEVLERYEAVAAKLSGKKTAPIDADDEEEEIEVRPRKGKDAVSFQEEETEVEAEDDEDFAPKKKTSKKKASSFEDEDDAETETEEAPAPKGKKKAKTTLDDVNDVCMNLAGKKNRAYVLALLKKNFKVSSVSELDEDDYEECVRVMTKG